jgi:hypothetical protein
MDRVEQPNSWQHQFWPEPWRSAWKLAVENGDTSRDPSCTTKLRPQTCLKLEMIFGRYQTYLAQNDLCDVGPSISPENLRAFGGNLIHSYRPSTAVAHAAMVIAAVRFMNPGSDVRDARAFIRFAVSRQRASRRKPSMQLSTHRLRGSPSALAIGKAIIAQSEGAAEPTAATARQYRIGALMVASALCPLRLREWCRMRIGENLDLGSNCIRLGIAGNKNDRFLVIPLPPELSALLRRYVAYYRPMVMKSGSQDQGYLWPSPTGGLSSPRALQRALKRMG